MIFVYAFSHKFDTKSRHFGSKTESSLSETNNFLMIGRQGAIIVYDIWLYIYKKQKYFIFSINVIFTIIQISFLKNLIQLFYLSDIFKSCTFLVFHSFYIKHIKGNVVKDTVIFVQYVVRDISNSCFNYFCALLHFLF